MTRGEHRILMTLTSNKKIYLSIYTTYDCWMSLRNVYNLYIFNSYIYEYYCRNVSDMHRFTYKNRTCEDEVDRSAVKG